MADFGQLVDQLHAEARVADAKREGAAAERLRELADDVGEMTGEQREWLEQANEDEVRGFVRAIRLLTGGA
ncbi:MAG TPA: hypothetical protein VMI13_05650 [Solirubrobacteraceae bacterium]|nr:hypothetical protein [Solirubrobacteraceae bacterium]